MTRFSAVIPVHNAVRVIGTTVRALRALAGPDLLEVIVIDDASTDGFAESIDELHKSAAIIVRHGANRGRSAARNSGAAAATGSYLLFIDADAMPTAAGFLEAYEVAIASGADLIFGAYASARSDFWSRYEALSLERAISSFRAGEQYSMSSRNFLIARSQFEKCGGFDERYRHYGFEDRDLFLRAIAGGARTAIASQAVVVHKDRITLPFVMRKMREAGQHTSGIFRADHQEAYARLGYCAIDARDHPVRGLFAGPVVALMLMWSGGLEGLLQSKHVPFGAKAKIVRLASGLSFLDGTRTAAAHGATNF